MSSAARWRSRAGVSLVQRLPAEVFMGDVGALALGPPGHIAIIVRQEIVLFIMGGVFVAETVSVMVQVLISN